MMYLLLCGSAVIAAIGARLRFSYREIGLGNTAMLSGAVTGLYNTIRMIGGAQ